MDFHFESFPEFLPAMFFLLRRIKKCFTLPHFAAFSTFCVKSFLTSLG